MKGSVGAAVFLWIGGFISLTITSGLLGLIGFVGMVWAVWRVTRLASDVEHALEYQGLVIEAQRSEIRSVAERTEEIEAKVRGD